MMCLCGLLKTLRPVLATLLIVCLLSHFAEYQYIVMCCFAVACLTRLACVSPHKYIGLGCG